jgi:hypothetical protein
MMNFKRTEILALCAVNIKNLFVFCIFTNLLSGCNNIDFTTSHGMIFFIDSGINLTQEEVEYVTDQFVVEYSTFTGVEPQEVRSQLNHTQVTVNDRLYKCSYSPKGLCYGFYYADTKNIYIALTPEMTLCQTAYWHELVHLEMCEIEKLCGSGLAGNDSIIIKSIVKNCKDLPKTQG